MPAIAKNADDAKTQLTSYCADISFDPEWISPEKWQTTIGIACDKQYGLEEAKRTIQQDMLDLAGSKAKENRQATLDGDPDDLFDTIEATPALNNTLAHKILKLCATAYVGGERVNLGLGLGGKKKMPPAEYTTLCGLWTLAAGHITGAGVFTEFVSHPPQDKAALGKGNVGATLDTRGLQGNLLVKINGVRFNMHIDIAG
ncbi:hypothetical protein [Streptomyces sp. SID12501]|uniref:Uncharacterized protein n=1 Tax=Streptomyces sp. SID12501 TaxID=2706042 RepID=A0A6B3BY36_9ACTN|nr:hypothetical protein [Streptomyces sp. SID12501]NEC89050.1 hypothetical protein [Streptomyces sp. SID12501]